MLPLNIDPATLRYDRKTGIPEITALYRTYGQDLKELCQELQGLRAGMLKQGYSADFSDCEGELLYLAVRAMAPETVVEISPCHGYSTNYILAALTHNRKGTLYSFEIQEHVAGRSIQDVIEGNLIRHADRSRLKLFVGDVMKNEAIPACDFLFLDSCHEAYFAAWYGAMLLEKAKFVFVHDLLIEGDSSGGLVPKAAFLGIAEQYYLLQALHLNRQSCGSVAAIRNQIDPALREHLPIRHQGAGERSIFFKGHPQSESAQRLHAAQGCIEEIKKLGQRGFRDVALERIKQMTSGTDPLFSRLQAVACLPQMGYRYPLFDSMFPHLEINWQALTVSELVVLLEIALTSCNRVFLRQIMTQAKKSSIDPGTYRYLTNHYYRMASGEPLLRLGSAARWLQSRVSR